MDSSPNVTSNKLYYVKEVIQLPFTLVLCMGNEKRRPDYLWICADHWTTNVRSK